MIFTVLPSFQIFQCFCACTVDPQYSFFSLSLPRIWLSRSTSKIDARGVDETPLRLTASQTATTQAVMVSGIMDELDIPPTLHFVEPCLKINGEEWTSTLRPIAQLSRNLGVSFYFSWTNAPSLASWLVITAGVARQPHV